MSTPTEIMFVARMTSSASSSGYATSMRLRWPGISRRRLATGQLDRESVERPRVAAVGDDAPSGRATSSCTCMRAPPSTRRLLKYPTSVQYGSRASSAASTSRRPLEQRRVGADHQRRSGWSPGAISPTYRRVPFASAAPRPRRTSRARRGPAAGTAASPDRTAPLPAARARRIVAVEATIFGRTPVGRAQEVDRVS